MPIRNQDWYNENESRPFPVSDEATNQDDAGVQLPGDLVVDVQISFPAVAATRAFLGAVTVTKTLTSVVILGADDLDAPTTIVPLASINLPKPCDAYRTYPMEALYPGVTGWITFGNEAAREDPNVEVYSGRFTLPRQSVLHPSTTAAVDELPIRDVGKLGNSAPLTGIVRLSGGNDIEIVKETLELPNISAEYLLATARSVVVVRLKESGLDSGDGFVPAISGSQRVNVFSTYAGPCASRPESYTCGDPQPIELLGSVPPDCCGNITLLFRGCADLSAVETAVEVDLETSLSISEQFGSGVIVDCHLGLVDACLTPDRLPDESGVLPNEYEDLCESVSSVSISVPTPTPDPTFVLDATQEAAYSGTPVAYDFSLYAPPANRPPYIDGLDILAGNFAYMYEPSLYGGDLSFMSSEVVGGEGARNILAMPGSHGLYRRVEATVHMRQGPQGTPHNVAVFCGLQETVSGNRIYKYVFAELDYDGYAYGYKLLRLGQFDGSKYKTLLAIPVPNLALEVEYKLHLYIYPHTVDGNITDDVAFISGVLQKPDDENFDDIPLGPVYVDNYGNHSGRMGIATNRAWARFPDVTIGNTDDTI